MRWRDLSSVELRRRLEQRGHNRRTVDLIVDNREHLSPTTEMLLDDMR